MHFLEIIYQKARKNKRKVVFPEGNDKRIIQAVSEIVNLNLAQPILLGEADKILKKAEDIGVILDLDKIEIVDILKSSEGKRYVRSYYDLCRGKISENSAKKTIGNPLYFGAMMVKQGAGDAMVAGAVNPTADVFRSTFQIIAPAKGVKTVSSYFLMSLSDCSYGEEGMFLFADAGIVPEPSAVQLANIAISTAKSFVSLLNLEPRVAMLSFSTKNSAHHRSIERVQKATQIVKKKAPDLIIDGELQVDTAIVPEVAQRKAPNSPVKGRANILIFPDLDAGNIAYKLVERLAKAEAYGPVLQGLNKPVSDLSRGCSVKDIINCSAIAAASL